MATRVSEDTEVASHYATQVALTAALMAALRRLWPTVNPLTSSEARARYGDGVAAVVDQFSAASVSLSADYYFEMRSRAGVPGSFRVPVIDTPPRSLIDAGLDWAISAQAEMDRTVEEIQAKVDAAMQKAVTDAGRDQVIAAVEGDELALGFVRVAKPDACYWCVSQAIRRTDDGRLGVYKSRSSAGQLPPNELGEINRFHNNCQCTVQPVFGSDYTLTPEMAALEDLYQESTKHSKSGQLLNDFRVALEAHRNGAPIAEIASPVGGAVPAADQMTALLGRLAGN